MGAMVMVLAMTLVMAIIIIPIATVTITMGIPTEITTVAGLVIVTRMVIVDQGVDPGTGDDLRNSDATSSILNLKIEMC